VITEGIDSAFAQAHGYGGGCVTALATREFSGSQFWVRVVVEGKPARCKRLAKEVVEIHFLPTQSLFGDGIPRNLPPTKNWFGLT
jgi:hypothetical protein